MAFNIANYEIGPVVAENQRHRLRKCVELGTGREVMLQTAIDAAQNQYLSRNAWALTKLKSRALEIDALREAEGKRSLGYIYGFPELCSSDILPDQGFRQVNVIGFHNVDCLSKIVPLVKLWKDSLRVDLQSSAWMLGKLLKLIAFAHDNNLEIVDISGNNVLIEPDKHYIIVFNWSDAVVHERGVPLKVAKQEIQKAANLIIRVIGDLQAACETRADSAYINYVQHLATGGESDVYNVHKTFYEIVDSLCSNPDSTWKPGFHEFSTLVRG